MSLNSGSASVGTNTAVLAKECSSQTNASAGAASYRGMGMGMAMHHSQPLLTAINPDFEPIVHGTKSLTARYATPFGYENGGAYCPVGYFSNLYINSL